MNRELPPLTQADLGPDAPPAETFVHAATIEVPVENIYFTEEMRERFDYLIYNITQPEGKVALVAATRKSDGEVVPIIAVIAEEPGENEGDPVGIQVTPFAILMVDADFDDYTPLGDPS